MSEILSQLVAMITGSIVVAAFLAWDRRRLDAWGRARAWHPATFALAIGSPALGLGVPPLFSCAAHVWITRWSPHAGAPWRAPHERALLAVGAGVACQLAHSLLAILVISALRLPMPE